MPLFPSLVGGIEIRERRQRYPGEARYKRLDFVKTRKSTYSDEWDIVRIAPEQRYIVENANDARYIQYQQPALGYYPPQPQLQYQPQPPQLQPQHQQHPYPEQHHPYHEQHQFQPQHQNHPQQGQYPHHADPHLHEGHGHPPPPPPPPMHPHPGQQQRGPHPQLMIEQGHHHPHGMIQVLGDDDEDDVNYVEIGPRVRIPSHQTQPRSHSRPRARMERLSGGFGSSSDDDSDDGVYRGRQHSRRRRSRSSGRLLRYDSDDDAWRGLIGGSAGSRSRSRPRPLRGW